MLNRRDLLKFGLKALGLLAMASAAPGMAIAAIAKEQKAKEPEVLYRSGIHPIKLLDGEASMQWVDDGMWGGWISPSNNLSDVDPDTDSTRRMDLGL